MMGVIGLQQKNKLEAIHFVIYNWRRIDVHTWQPYLAKVATREAINFGTYSAWEDIVYILHAVKTVVNPKSYATDIIIITKQRYRFV